MKVIMHAIVRKLLLAAILANYLLEFFYTVGRLVGVGLWLQPIDTSTTEGMISFELYTFELILVAQFFAIWLLSWLKKWKIHMRTSWIRIRIMGATHALERVLASGIYQYRIAVLLCNDI